MALALALPFQEVHTHFKDCMANYDGLLGCGDDPLGLSCNILLSPPGWMELLASYKNTIGIC